MPLMTGSFRLDQSTFGLQVRTQCLRDAEEFGFPGLCGPVGTANRGGDLRTNPLEGSSMAEALDLEVS